MYANFNRLWTKTQYTNWLNSGELQNDEVEVLQLNNNNDIRYLSDNIYKLINLKEINLSRTPITQLPSSIGDLKNLEELYLQNSKIESLPEELKNIKKPIKIVANNTPLSENPNFNLENWPPNFYIFLKMSQFSLLPATELFKRYKRENFQKGGRKRKTNKRRTNKKKKINKRKSRRR